MKMHKFGFTLLSGLLAVGLLTSQPVLAADSAFHLLKEIPVRDNGKWTAMALDEAGQRLYAAHGGRIEVINTAKDSPVGAITDVSDIQDFIIVPTFRMGYAVNGKSDEVCLVDIINLRTTAKMKTGKNPGTVIYEPSRLEIYVLNRGDNSAFAGEADDGDYEATIELSGKPASAVADDKARYDSKKGDVYVALEDKNEVVVVDAQSRKVTERWPVAPGQSPRSMAYDSVNHRLLVACANKLLVLMDTTNGKVLGTAAIGDGAGNVVYDPGTQNAFCAAADGTVSIVHMDAPDKLTVLQTLKTKPGASVLGVDGKTHKIYVGLTDFAGAGANPLPNSLKILVYGM